MIYERIKALCKKNDISVNELENEIKIARGSLCKVGKHKPNSNKMQAVAKRLNTTVDYLMTGKEPETQRYDEELAEKDVALLDLSEEIKDCALRMSKLSEDRLNALLCVIKAHLDLEESR